MNSVGFFCFFNKRFGHTGEEETPTITLTQKESYKVYEKQPLAISMQLAHLSCFE